MNLSSCDIGNTAYDKEQKGTELFGSITVPLFDSEGEMTGTEEITYWGEEGCEEANIWLGGYTAHKDDVYDALKNVTNKHINIQLPF